MENKMSFTKLFCLLCCMFTVMMSHIASQAITYSDQTTRQRCQLTFSANSAYDRNRDQMLSSLVSNVLLTKERYYVAATGEDPDKVHVLALCRGDSSQESCTTCINSTVRDILTTCPNQKEAFAWGSTNFSCLVHYADHSFLGKMDLESVSYTVINNSTSSMESDAIWASFVDRLVTQTSTSSSKLKFSTDEAQITQDQKIYTLMQCTPDISQSNCSYCLRESAVKYAEGRDGGTVQRPNCMVRWENYPFYAPKQASPPPVVGFPPPSPNRTITLRSPPPSPNGTTTPRSPPPSPNGTTTPRAPPPSPNGTTTPRPPPPSPNGTTTLRLPPLSPNGTTTIESQGIGPKIVAAIAVSIIIFLGLVALTCFLLQKKNRKRRITTKLELNAKEIEALESLQFELNTIRVATDNFAVDNKLGQGGFGAVYKGRLPDGMDIAVKRLSKNSGQGEIEFKNEVLLVARLQHRNLVRLLGFCLGGNERLLIYEFVPNSSLDNFIFDPTKRPQLDWETRHKIIKGIARGILYLHEDSRLRIIHRDLKASNILLDADMNPKIADFGMARLFEMDQTEGNTRRVVGTFGYMAPEYLTRGNFSVKSDIFSFGVLVLEVISGKKVHSFRDENGAQDLLAFAWKNWSEGTILNLIDPVLRADYNGQMMRCINIGLLCVQENVDDRPTISLVLQMLTKFSLSISAPSRPALFMHTIAQRDNPNRTNQSNGNVLRVSINEVSITELTPR